MKENNKSARQSRAELTAGFILLVLSTLLIIALPTETKISSRLPLTKQPGLWPAIALIIMLISALLYTVLKWKEYRSISTTLAQSSDEVVGLGDFSLCFEHAFYFILYVYSIDYIGYLFSTLLFMSFVVYRAGYRTRYYMSVSLLIGLGIVVLFKSLLKANLPTGMIYNYLPSPLDAFFINYF